MKLFYYIKDKENKPVITVCLIQDGSKWSRGIAICSKKDIPNKKIGRAIAEGRAQKALELFDSTLDAYCRYPINRKESRWVIQNANLVRENPFVPQVYKGMVITSIFQLTRFEQDLIEKNTKKEIQ